jgi:hypothetical protein
MEMACMRLCTVAADAAVDGGSLDAATVLAVQEGSFQLPLMALQIFSPIRLFEKVELKVVTSWPTGHNFG